MTVTRDNKGAMLPGMSISLLLHESKVKLRTSVYEQEEHIGCGSGSRMIIFSAISPTVITLDAEGRRT